MMVLSHVVYMHHCGCQCIHIWMYYLWRMLFVIFVDELSILCDLWLKDFAIVVVCCSDPIRDGWLIRYVRSGLVHRL